jgi:PAS domain S-box-containing protein
MGKEPRDSALLRLVSIVESADAAIYSAELDGTITSWNRAAARIFGYAASEALGQSLDIIIPPDRRNEEVGIIGRIRAGQSVGQYDTVRRRRDGLLLHVSMTVSPIRAANGDVIGISKIARDITEQRTLELQARHLAAIVESSDDVIVSKDLDGTIQSWNRAAERVFGYTAHEVIGRSIRIIVPADRQSEEDDVLRRIRRGEAIDHYETVRCAKDGTCIPISLTVSPIRDRDGRIVGASKIARDISERKRSAERATFLAEAGRALATSLDYEATLTAIANLAVPAIADWCAVYIVSEDGTIERLAGAHRDPAKLELIRALRARYDDSKSPNSPAHVIRTAEPVILPSVSDELIVGAARGDQQRIELVRSLGVVSYLCVPLIAHGTTLGALTWATAESGRKYTADDLQFAQEVAYRAALAVDNARAYKNARVASQLKDEFLATASHELRTPLNAILGYARLLRSGTMPAEKKAHAEETIERNAIALAQIVEDILDVSRIVSGKIRLDVQAVDLPSVVKHAIETTMPAADAKEIRVETMLDPRASPIAGDPDRVQQIVWNLVSNAVKFTPKRGHVQVRVERTDSSAEIVVSDTGIGIKPEFLPHLFERFRQGDAGTSRENSGLGLGLAIVRHLVELHGGTVSAASAGPDQGSTFRVRLPIMIARADRAVATRQEPVGTESAATSSMALEGIHVLAVDDDRDALTLVREIALAAGARVTTAASAAQALDQVEAAAPDVIVADVGLPLVDGFAFIRQVRTLSDSRLRHIPAAALTAYARSEDRVKAFQSGFQMHLAKPIDPAELVAAIATLAKRSPSR